MVAESWRQRQGRRRNKVSALDTTLDPSLNGYDNVQELLEALTDLGGSTAQIITPEGLGADNTGMTDAFPQVKEAIETAAAGGFRCELRGQYKLIPTSTIELSSGLLVQGGGRLHVAGAPIGNRLIDINIAPLATLTILAIADSTYDYAGVNRTSFGLKDDTAAANPLVGVIFYAALWAAKLDDAEVKALAAGALPTRVRPAALWNYWPSFGRNDGSIVKDVKGRSPLTISLGQVSTLAARRRSRAAGGVAA